MKRLRNELGAAAVEFALVVPVLFSLLFGIVEFGHIFNAQIQVTAAAREGARSMALSNSVTTAQATTVAAAPGLNPLLTSAQIVIAPASCGVGSNTTVTVNYTVPSITGLFSTGITIKGTSVMRCGG